MKGGVVWGVQCERLFKWEVICLSNILRMYRKRTIHLVEPPKLEEINDDSVLF